MLEKYKSETEVDQQLKQLAGAFWNALQHYVTDLQTRLDQEHNARLQMTELQKELDGKLHPL